MIRQIIQGYLLLGFGRGLHQISMNPQFYPGILGGYFNLCFSDPFSVLPILAGFCTYQVLIRSFHPFTINLSKRNKYFISFVVAVGFIPLPISYVLAYASFATTHIIINSLTK